ncbi:hypothetical protein I5L01_16000 [Erythrobacter sp. YJ-T3-07]|nr:hypothetical protein [Erythrobacter sp. YJ-T3-07]
MDVDEGGEDAVEEALNDYGIDIDFDKLAEDLKDVSLAVSRPFASSNTDKNSLRMILWRRNCKAKSRP